VERRQQIGRVVYTMAAVDTAVVFLVVALALVRPWDITLLAAVCFPSLLLVNFLFLRGKLSEIGPPATEEQTVPRSRRFCIYACAAVFFAGTLYGLLMVMQGEIPRTVLPLLLIPLSLAIYSLKTARRVGTRKPS